MIERCPHCRKDVMFTRGICPQCGYTSRPEDRTEPTEIERRQQDPSTPSYTMVFDEAMTEAERRGRIELWLITVVFLVPDALWIVRGLLDLQFSGWSVLRLAVLYVLVRALWQGRVTARIVAQVLAPASGIVLLALPLVCPDRFELVERVLVVGAGVLQLLAAYPLWRSTDLRDYLRRRHHEWTTVQPH